MQKKVLLLPGDGIGQEVVAAATQVMQAAAQQSGCNLEISEALVGGAAIDATGEPLPSATLAAAEQVDAVLLVELVARSEMICLLICDPRKVCWVCVRGWRYLRICGRRYCPHR